MAEDNWYKKLAKKGYLGTAAQMGEETGRASWEEHSDRQMKKYHGEMDEAEEKEKKERIRRDLGAAGM